MYRVSLFVALLFISQISFGQNKKGKSKQKNAEQIILTNLQSHVNYLTADKLEGRRTGTNGENWQWNI